jgi:hypothetical protein
MIELPNGDLWILDEKEVEDQTARYEDVMKNPKKYFPLTTPKEFIHTYVESDRYFLPRKFTEEFGGFFDANFSIEEVFEAVSITNYEFYGTHIYLLNWGEVLVYYHHPGCCYQDVETTYKIIKDVDTFRNMFLANLYKATWEKTKDE